MTTQTLLDELRDIAAEDLEPDAHMLAHLAALLREYRNRLAKTKGVPTQSIAVDDVVEGLRSISRSTKPR